MRILPLRQDSPWKCVPSILEVNTGIKVEVPKRCHEATRHPVVCLMGALIKVLFICILLDAMICVSRGPWLARRWVALPATRSLWLSMKSHVTWLILQVRSSRPLTFRSVASCFFFQASKRFWVGYWGKSRVSFQPFPTQRYSSPLWIQRVTALVLHGAMAAHLWLNGVSKIVSCRTGKYISRIFQFTVPYLEPSSQLPICHGNHRPLLPNMKGTGRWGCSISVPPKTAYNQNLGHSSGELNRIDLSLFFGGCEQKNPHGFGFNQQCWLNPPPKCRNIISTILLEQPLGRIWSVFPQLSTTI